MSKDYIEIKGARVNNLKNVDVRIPRNKLIVIAGVSGSGKSSLVNETLMPAGCMPKGSVATLKACPVMPVNFLAERISLNVISFAAFLRQ